MTRENIKDRYRMRLLTPRRSPEIDNLVEETKERLENARAFLDRIEDGQERTRRYLEEFAATLENDLRRLEKNRDDAARHDGSATGNDARPPTDS